MEENQSLTQLSSSANQPARGSWQQELIQTGLPRRVLPPEPSPGTGFTSAGDARSCRQRSC